MGDDDGDMDPEMKKFDMLDTNGDGRSHCQRMVRLLQLTDEPMSGELITWTVCWNDG